LLKYDPSEGILEILMRSGGVTIKRHGERADPGLGHAFTLSVGDTGGQH